MIDRQEAIEILIDHFENPRHRGQLDDADVAMPGGNPGCGDVIMVYLKGEGEHELTGLTWEGEGHTAYPSTKCIVDAVDGYLIDLRVPQEGLRCPPK